MMNFFSAILARCSLRLLRDRGLNKLYFGTVLYSKGALCLRTEKLPIKS